ncbi:hypothetical protein BJ742DRAFT_850719 [Cladochytrium replicatum]|nr:hypothetical protein BJ742DRAFT_850719 [Cladochytrium replicatum]
MLRFCRRFVATKTTVPRWRPQTRGYGNLSLSAEDDAAVKKVVESHVNCTNPDDWRKISLHIPALKFRVVRDVMLKVDCNLSNVDLTNIRDVEGIMQAIQAQRSLTSQANPFSRLDPVQRYFELQSDNLPSNIHWQPPAPKPILSKRDRKNKIK